MNHENLDSAKHLGDALSLLIVAGALAKILPPLSALVALIYTLIRIWETKTVGRFIGRVE